MWPTDFIILNPKIWWFFQKKRDIVAEYFLFIFIFCILEKFWRQKKKKTLATTKGQTRILGWHKGIILPSLLTLPKCLWSWILIQKPTIVVVGGARLLWKIPWPPLNLIRNLVRSPVHHKLHIHRRSPG
jgi:hypothetical protein